MFTDSHSMAQTDSEEILLGPFKEQLSMEEIEMDWQNCGPQAVF